MGRRRFGPHGRPGRLYCRRMRECATFWWALRSARGWDRPSPPSERALTITGAVSDCHALHDDGGWCPACAPEPTPEREPFQPLSIPPFMARSLTSLTTIAILWRGCGVPKGVKSGPSPPEGPGMSAPAARRPPQRPRDAQTSSHRCSNGQDHRVPGPGLQETSTPPPTPPRDVDPP